MPFDAIVIGSGFGGAITACRLAQAGRSVLVLERGRRWGPASFPRHASDAWFWHASAPATGNGLLDFRQFPRMCVAQAAGVGGGSLIYANVSCEAPASVFDSGWPPEITYAALKPHYDTVGRVMNVQRMPPAQWTPRMHLMKEAAETCGFGHRFQELELAVTFDASLAPGAARQDPLTVTMKPNAHGAAQGHCVHCGECILGCRARAKNTLDLNYLHLAENEFHADLRELHLVDRIERQVDGTYRVAYDRLVDGRRAPGSETAPLVVVAAGSLGSTELLLRSRDVRHCLDGISPRLGRGWSANGDFVTPALHLHRDIDPDIGPTIGSAISFQDGSIGGHRFWIQDGGVPSLAAAFLQAGADMPKMDAGTTLALTALRRATHATQPLRHLMPWFAQGCDAPDGTLSLRGNELHLAWHSAASKPLIDAIVAMHRHLAAATGGHACVPPTWSMLGQLVTPHPLGGCNMGESAAEGVVDWRGEVFGSPNLFVADGAIVPRPLGVNPSRTIGALAEHVAAGIVAS